MLIIPAIDLRAGRCVRLVQGKLENEEIYSTDPVFIAKLWQSRGAKRLHVIDLDGAFSGAIKNIELITEIIKGVNIPVQVGGGLRTKPIVEKVLEIGADKVILSTVLIYQPKLLTEIINTVGSERVIAAIDVQENKIVIGGWKDTTAVTPNELLDKIADTGIKEIICTDTTRDGTLQGPNFKMIEQICTQTKLSVYAAGGIGTIDHIRRLKDLESVGLQGVILGKSLYTESIKIEDAISIATGK